MSAPAVLSEGESSLLSTHVRCLQPSVAVAQEDPILSLVSKGTHICVCRQIHITLKSNNE